MPNIDVTKIAGFNEMTPEEQVKALTEYEFDDNADVVERYKKRIDELTHEASVNKKKSREEGEQFNSTLTEKNKELEELQGKVDAIMKEKSIADNTAQFLNLGYSKELAEETAKALVDGNNSKVFENQKLFQDELVKKLQAEALKNTPAPKGGNGEGNNIVTKDDFLKMSYEEMIEFNAKHPEEYAKFTNQN